ncbi:MAG: exonuclease SbcCD subunit D, partial [Lachnospiraceae bacterium]
MKSKSRKAEILQGFLRVVEYCRSHEADVLMIAGDLFDNDNIDTAAEEQIKQALGSIPQVDVYIAPGNHDPFTSTSPYSREGWSENVIIFDAKPRIIERPDKGYRIWGCGFESGFSESRFMMGVRMPKDELINLGIVHGQLVGKNGSSTYNPITDADIDKSGFDYLALGHVHKQTEINRIGNTFFAYPGTPEGQGFDEDGIKGFYTGEISKKLLARNELIMEYVSLSMRKYYHVNVDVTGADSRQELFDRIEKALEDTVKDDITVAVEADNRIENNLYKLTLEGALEQRSFISVEELTAKLAMQLYYITIKDNTTLLIDYEALARENSLKGIYTAKMLDNIRMKEQAGDEAGAALYKKALELGIRAFDGEVSVNEN